MKAITLYKLTNQNLQTHGGYQWELGVWKSAPGNGELCSTSWLHAYESPELAVLLNPIHGRIKNPLLWRAEGKGKGLDDNGLKCGVTKLRLLEQVIMPVYTPVQKAAFSIYCALFVFQDKNFIAWAEAWLARKNRTAYAAAAANAAAYTVAAVATNAAIAYANAAVTAATAYAAATNAANTAATATNTATAYAAAVTAATAYATAAAKAAANAAANTTAAVTAATAYAAYVATAAATAAAANTAANTATNAANAASVANAVSAAVTTEAAFILQLAAEAAKDIT